MDRDSIDMVAVAVEHGEATREGLVRELLGSTLAAPTSEDPTGGFVPLLAEIDGVPHMVVATSTAGLQKSASAANFAVTLRGEDVIRGLDPNYGVFVNTASTAFALSPQLPGGVASRTRAG
ncbi:hypothetical protein AAHB33_13965 [Paenarthrobacter sp. S56]|uniref:hypothetical protein n=1 Tax=Paenarthrobacter sp. S56 TaxID=3138179 RepID=UPI00321BD920